MLQVKTKKPAKLTFQRKANISRQMPVVTVLPPTTVLVLEIPLTAKYFLWQMIQFHLVIHYLSFLPILFCENLFWSASSAPWCSQYREKTSKDIVRNNSGNKNPLPSFYMYDNFSSCRIRREQNVLFYTNVRYVPIYFSPGAFNAVRLLSWLVTDSASCA